MQLSADNLAKVRHARRLTQTKVAELAGVSVPYINQIERGHMPMSERVRVKLTEALQLTPEIIHKINELDAEINGSKLH